MKYQLQTIIGVSAVAAATPLNKRDPAPFVDEWSPIINGDDGASCADLAVIFARGTFDSDNLGVWVGGPLSDALHSKHSSVAVTGVSSDEYDASLSGYLEEGSPQSCADSLGNSVQSYASKCADTKFVIAGWSQGALCAHKALGSLGDAGDRVIALATFGDPVDVWSNDIDFPELPSNAKSLAYCESSITDPLCGDPIDDFPKDPASFINKLKDMWDDVSTVDLNSSQQEAVKDVAAELPKQALQMLDTFGSTILGGNARRLMLTPQHFWYGVDGTTSKAADDIVAAAGGN